MTSLAELSYEPDPVAAADVAIGKLKLSGETRVVLRPAVIAFFRVLRRDQARATEREAAQQLAEGQSPRVALTAPKLLRSGFMLPDGQFVTWATATVEQHEARIALLRSKIDGIARTIRLHEYAILRIKAEGVSCLGESSSTESAA